MSTIFDVAVMGGGPGGYVAALRAAQNGLSVVCIDDGVNAQGEPSPGGTCLNVGCIPSKSLLQSSELYAQVQHEASIHGVNVEGVSFNAAAMIQRKDAIVSRLTMGISLLFKKNKVKHLCGLATLERAQDEIWQLRVNDQHIHARNVVIATGSQPRQLPGVTIDNQQILDNRGALALSEVPPRLGVIGAGVIGLELGSVWNRVGSDVTLLEMAPTFLPALEARLSNEVRKAMIASGMKMQLAVEIEAIEQRDDGVHVRWRQGEKREESRFDKLILAIGRVPRLSGVDLVQLGLEADNRGGIAVDNLCRTGKAGLWAIGDVVRGPMLAHKAMAEGVVVADQIAGLAVEPINFALIPSVIYTQPVRLNRRNAKRLRLRREYTTIHARPCKSRLFLRNEPHPICDILDAKLFCKGFIFVFLRSLSCDSELYRHFRVLLFQQCSCPEQCCNAIFVRKRFHCTDDIIPAVLGVDSIIPFPRCLIR